MQLPNALVQLQARYNHCGEAASEKCLSAATFVRLLLVKAWPATRASSINEHLDGDRNAAHLIAAPPPKETGVKRNPDLRREVSVEIHSAYVDTKFLGKLLNEFISIVTRCVQVALDIAARCDLLEGNADRFGYQASNILVGRIFHLRQLGIAT
jgi:hypothetical protein